MSRCKQRAKKRHGRLVTRVVRGGKKSKELNEEELLQDKWTSWRPERVTDEGYATSEYISCSRTAIYSMHESIYGARRLDSANRCWIASTFSFRSSVTQDGTYSQALTRHDSHRVIRTPSASRLLSLRLLLSHVSCVLIYYYFFFGNTSKREWPMSFYDVDVRDYFASVFTLLKLPSKLQYPVDI